MSPAFEGWASSVRSGSVAATTAIADDLREVLSDVLTGAKLFAAGPFTVTATLRGLGTGAAFTFLPYVFWRDSGLPAGLWPWMTITGSVLCLWALIRCLRIIRLRGQSTRADLPFDRQGSAVLGLIVAILLLPVLGARMPSDLMRVCGDLGGAMAWGVGIVELPADVLSRCDQAVPSVTADELGRIVQGIRSAS